MRIPILTGKIPIIRIIFLLLSFLNFQPSAGQENRTFQIWNLNSFSARLNNKNLLSVSEKIHYSVSDKAYDIKYGEVQFRHIVNPVFTYGSGLRLVKINIPGGWGNEQRPMIFALLDRTVKNFKFSLLNRIEYRFLDFIPNHIRNMEKFDVNFPPFPSLKMALFCSGEAFTKLNIENLHLVRYYAGLRNSGSKHFDIKLYYVLQKEKYNKTWQSSDVLGLNIGYIL